VEGSPRRIQRKRGEPLPATAKFVGRGTFWMGTPPYYLVTKPPPLWPRNRRWSREEAVKCYAILLAGGWRLRRPPGYVLVQRAMEELEGFDLACDCPEGAPCHADILLKYANP
jgi:Domain of unknown function (DUF4326)